MSLGKLSRLAVLFLAATPILVSAAGPPPAPPIPAEISAAKTVFLGNGGDECLGFVSGDRAFADFYAAMRSWGRFELAASPAAAQLGLTLRFSCPIVVPGVTHGNSGSSQVLSRLTLVIRDVATRATLWTVVIPVDPAILQSHRNDNVDAAVGKLISSLDSLAAGAAPPPIRVAPPN